MQWYIGRRIGEALITMLLLSIVVFVSSHATGDPALVLLPTDATIEVYEIIRKNLGLDQPLVVQYGIFLKNFITGHFGYSTLYRRPVEQMLLERLPATFMLAGVAMAMAVLIGIPLGVVSAMKRGTPLDWLARLFAVLGQAAPQFWVGIVLIFVFAANLKLLPATGRGGPEHLVLPGITAALLPAAGMARLTRSSLLDVLNSDYIRTAHAKGLPGRTVMWRHALKNALLPVLTFGGLTLGGMLNGIIVVEAVFGWPGVGRLSLEGVIRRDFPLVQGSVMMTAFFYIFVSLLVDILYGYIDPRIKLT